MGKTLHLGPGDKGGNPHATLESGPEGAQGWTQNLEGALVPRGVPRCHHYPSKLRNLEGTSEVRLSKHEGRSVRDTVILAKPEGHRDTSSGHDTIRPPSAASVPLAPPAGRHTGQRTVS